MKNLTIIVLIAFGIAAGFFIFQSKNLSSVDLDKFAQCLSEKGAVMYGAYWCPHCQNEKDAFGDSFRYVRYVECTEKPQECLAQGIKGYPAWVFSDGRKLEGEQGIENLSRESGCSLEIKK